jgi:glycolate oxidase FAD binding subunit
VLPLARGTRTVCRRIDAQGALDLLGAVVQRGVPVTGSFWCGGDLYVRLEGSASSLEAVAPAFGGDAMDAQAAAAFWRSVREQTHPYFASTRSLWRLSLPATATGTALQPIEHAAFEWNGTQAWLGDVERPQVERIARAAGGHASLFRHGDPGSDLAGEVFAPLPAPLLALHRAVKRVFDPAGILNPGRMYADL